MIPSLLKFSIPYKDGSGNRLEIQFNKESREVHVIQGGAVVFINFEDIAWFAEAFEEIAGCVEQAQEEVNGS